MGGGRRRGTGRGEEERKRRILEIFSRASNSWNWKKFPDVSAALRILGNSLDAGGRERGREGGREEGMKGEEEEEEEEEEKGGEMGVVKG